jgi:hypothetical protein
MASTSSTPIQAEDDGITLNELLSRSISGAERVIDAPSPNDAGIQVGFHLVAHRCSSRVSPTQAPLLQPRYRLPMKLRRSSSGLYPT